MNRQGIGLFEVVVFALFSLGVYALIERNVRKHEEKPAPSSRVREQPAPPEPEPEPEPEPDVVAVEPLPPDPLPPDPAPDTVGQDDIESALRAIQPALDGCQRRHPASGVIWAQVEIGGSGRVTRVRIDESPDEGLSRCVASALKKLKLARTGSSTSFSIPISFD